MGSQDSTTFGGALRSAIRANGLTLQGVQARLARRGVHVSVAALSSWQSGLNRPERPGSLRAVAELELLLDLGQGELMTLLGPRRPRGRQAGRPRTDLLPESGALAEMSDGQVDRVRLLYVEEHVRVNPDRTLREVLTKAVAQARGDGVSRYVAGQFAAAVSDLDQVRTVSTGRCRLGRMRRDHTRGLVATELLLDRVYHSGEIFTVEYKSVVGPPVLDDEYFRMFVAPIPLYVLQVSFARPAIPVRCHRFETPDWDHPRTDQEVDLTGHRNVLVAREGIRSGIYGVRWEWS